MDGGNMQSAYSQIMLATCLIFSLGGGGVLLVFWLTRKGWMSIHLMATGVFIFVIGLGAMTAWFLKDVRIILISLVAAIILGFRMLTNQQFIRMIEAANKAISGVEHEADSARSPEAIPKSVRSSLKGALLPYVAPVIGVALFAFMKSYELGFRLGVALIVTGSWSVLRFVFLKGLGSPGLYTRAHLLADALILIVTWGGGLILILHQLF